MTAYARLAVALVCTASVVGVARAALVYSAGEVLDTQTGFSWKNFQSLDAGTRAGYRPATVPRTIELFLHYSPPGSNSVSGWTPMWGAVFDHRRSPDGRHLSFQWTGEYFDDRPPSLAETLEADIRYGYGFKDPFTYALMPFVSDSNRWMQILIRNDSAYDQYNSSWGSGELFVDVRRSDLPPPDFRPLDCTVPWQFCHVPRDSHPYYDPDGALHKSGFLMIRSVPGIPEPSVYAMFLFGVGLLALRFRAFC